MNEVINRYNFFKNIKLTPEGYVEMIIVDYIQPQEDGIDQYKTFQILKLDEEGRLVVTKKPE